MPLPPQLGPRFRPTLFLRHYGAEPAGQLAGRLGSLGGLFGQAVQDNLIEGGWNGKLAVARRRHGNVVRMADQLLQRGGRLEDEVARDQPVGDAPQGVDVGAMIERPLTEDRKSVVRERVY